MPLPRLTWTVRFERAPDTFGDFWIDGDSCYEVEREADASVLVRRDLATGARRWATPVTTHLELEPPVVADSHIVVPVYTETSYDPRYEIHDLATGALERVIP